MVNKNIIEINKLAQSLNTAEDLKYILQIYNNVLDRINMSNSHNIQLGQRVIFNAGRRGLITGLLIAKNRKTWKVISDIKGGNVGRPITWRVSPHLIKLEQKAS